MENWKILDIDTNKRMWDFVCQTLSFNPYVDKKAKIISSLMPNQFYGISKYYNDGFSETAYNDLHEKAILSFKEIVRKDNLMYALNWQHDGYLFNPNLPFEKDEFDEWLAPFFPNGDYLFFLTSDLKNIAFCDGINLSIQLFGLEIINAFAKYKPLIFSNNSSY